MNRYIIVTHGSLGGELISTAAAIVGEYDNIEALTLDIGESFESFYGKVTDCVNRVMSEYGKENLLFFVDINGGTPLNVISLLLHDKGAYVITGVNLTMILEALESDKPINELAHELVEIGKEAISLL